MFHELFFMSDCILYIHLSMKPVEPGGYCNDKEWTLFHYSSYNHATDGIVGVNAVLFNSH
jgi:hypothetical protein